jgi:hypothetical protein
MRETRYVRAMRTRATLFGLSIAAMIAVACKKEPAPPVVDAGIAPVASPTMRGRSAPICARQDCATKQIVDDGCDDTGRCLSCVNLCDVPGQ